MSQEALRKVVQRAIDDAQFRRQLVSGSWISLVGYDLTAAEIAALHSRDAGKLGALGIDTRMSKMWIDVGSFGRASVAAHESVQSPDASDRNLAYLAAVEATSHAAQSPDAADRNLVAAVTEPSQVRDVPPVWIGEYIPESSYVAPVEGSPEAFRFDADASPQIEPAGADADLQQ